MKNIRDWFVKMTLLQKIIVLAVVILAIFFTYKKIAGSSSAKATYQTATAQKGTIISTVTGSGTVNSDNSNNITTQASGVVSAVYVKDGDKVKAGDKIAELDLDLEGQQKANQAWSAYLSAQNNLKSAQADLYTTQSTMFTDWNTFFNLATDSTYQNSDGSPNNTNRALPEFHIAQDNWLASEAKYKNQQNVVAQAQVAETAAWNAYQQASSIIYAPISGTVSGLSLQKGSVINSQSSNNTSATTTSIAGIKTDAKPTISIDLTEIDVPKIKVGDKATVTLDAFPNKTFTGKVISVDLIGVINSGVTNYPTVILLDNSNDEILPNMSATANIITATKNDALMVPTSAVTTANGASTVQVMQNGVPQTVSVTTGLTSDSDTEITSGLKEGDTVVTATISSAGASSTTRSVFSSFGGGGGGARFIGR